MISITPPPGLKHSGVIAPRLTLASARKLRDAIAVWIDRRAEAEAKAAPRRKA